jgi:1-aminocyclopropane-1-carboxylate deaminase/D-cysteine desulfhydrase-like pyridoxal-dependent ACC family enzyme
MREELMGMSDPDALTPIQDVENYFLKRDDVFHIGGVRGGKVRTCWFLAQGAKGLITAGARHSPQVAIVARIAKILGIPCRVHVPRGQPTSETISAENDGAEVVRHFPGYNTVIIARAREDASVGSGWVEIPFGMECQEAVNQTRRQVENIGIFHPRPKRIVVPVGSGMSLAGVLWGLKDFDLDIPVLGVSVGAEPTHRLDRYAPRSWRKQCVLVRSEIPYQRAYEQDISGIDLDPIYESKCVHFLEKGDLFWVIGHRDKMPESTSKMSPIPPTIREEEVLEWI